MSRPGPRPHRGAILTRYRRALLTILLALTACDGEVRFLQQLSLTRFFRGNLHAHTRRSDGDSEPAEMARWYRTRGYHFLAITDHNLAFPAAEAAALGQPGRFLIVPGEEISYHVVRGRHRIPVHLNGLCVSRRTGGGVLEQPAAALKQGLQAILGQPGAVAQINHPNARWALDAGTIAAALRGPTLLEIANQHPSIRNAGDAWHASAEAIWDELLLGGHPVHAVADDDSHDLVRTRRQLGHAPRLAGRGWVEVAAGRLDETAICTALEAGRFYSSTGVRLAAIEVRRRWLQLRISAPAGQAARYRTECIVDGGRLESLEVGLQPICQAAGSRYLRARVLGPGGAIAWTQAFPVELDPEQE